MALLSWILVSFVAFASMGEAHMSPGEFTESLVRQIEGGGDVRNFVERWFFGGLPDVPAPGTSGPVIELPNGLKEQTFLTPPITIGNGEIQNYYTPIEWPKGHIAVQSFTADVVKNTASGEKPPITPCCGGPNWATLQEAFLHHWTINKWQLPGSVYKKIIDEKGIDYVLHWGKDWKTALELLAADAGGNTGADGPCWTGTLHTYFGVGNEVRGNPLKPDWVAYDFPEPYAVEFNSEDMKRYGEFMVINTHLIDVRNVTDIRGCTECECKLLNVTPLDPRYLGGLNCCHSTAHDGGRCPLKDGIKPSNETYYIRYTLKWREFDTSTVAPLEVITLEMTDNNTHWSSFLPLGFPESHKDLKEDRYFQEILNNGQSGDFLGHHTCHVEWTVPPCPHGSSCLQKVHNSWEMPYPLDIVFVRNHLHNGAVNISTRVGDNRFCTGLPRYDPDNMLIDISTCRLGSPQFPQPVRAERGDRVSVEGIYSQDERRHHGVMGFSVLYAHRLNRGTHRGNILV